MSATKSPLANCFAPSSLFAIGECQQAAEFYPRRLLGCNGNIYTPLAIET